MHSKPQFTRPALAGAILWAAVVATALVTQPAAGDERPGAAPGGTAHNDAEWAREHVRRGEYVPLERIVADALARYPGRIIEAELDADEYEIELLTGDGIKVELEYDARSGRLMEVEYDD